MKNITIILIVLMALGCKNQMPEESKSIVEEIVYSAGDVRAAVKQFNKAVVKKDTALLNKLLHDSLSYGHSNGWIENKTELKNDLYNGTLTYNTVDQKEISVIMNDKVATVRGDVLFNVDYNEYDSLDFDLHVMQTWVWHEGKWKMLNRQSMANPKEENKEDKDEEDK